MSSRRSSANLCTQINRLLIGLIDLTAGDRAKLRVSNSKVLTVFLCLNLVINVFRDRATGRGRIKCATVPLVSDTSMARQTVYCIIKECGVTLQPIPEFPLRHSSKFNKIKIHTHTLYLSTDFIYFILYTLFL